MSVEWRTSRFTVFLPLIVLVAFTVEAAAVSVRTQPPPDLEGLSCLTSGSAASANGVSNGDSVRRGSLIDIRQDEGEFLAESPWPWLDPVVQPARNLRTISLCPDASTGVYSLPTANFFYIATTIGQVTVTVPLKPGWHLSTSSAQLCAQIASMGCGLPQPEQITISVM